MLDNEIKECYVYVYCDPRRIYRQKHLGFQFEFEPFYIGCGINNRIRDHLMEAISTQKSSTKLDRIRELLFDGFNPIIIKISESMIRSEALNLERQFVREIGTLYIIKNVPFGPLTNLMEGGRGGSISEETKLKMSQAKLGKEFTQEHKDAISRARLGTHHKPESIAKIKAYMATFTHSEETKQKISEANKLASKNPETWLRRSKGRLGKKHTEESKLKMSLASSGKTQSDETKQKLSKIVSNTKWIRKENVKKRVRENEIQAYLADGWIIGRGWV